MNAALTDIGRILDGETITEQLVDLERLPRCPVSVNTAADRYHPAVTAELIDAADVQGTNLEVPEDAYDDVLGALHDARDAADEHSWTDALFDRGWEAYWAGEDRDPAGEAVGILTASYAGGLGAGYVGAQTGYPVVGVATMFGSITAGKVGVVLGEQYWSGYRAAATVDAAEQLVTQYQADDEQYWLATDASYDPVVLRGQPPSVDETVREENMAGLVAFIDAHAPEELSAAQREEYAAYLEE